jgi:hypothetical protein
MLQARVSSAKMDQIRMIFVLKDDRFMGNSFIKWM